MGSLDGKIAIVTGASSGIGAGIAEMFVAQGACVGMAARRIERLDQRAKQLGPKSLAVRTDVTSEADIIALFDATEKAFGVPHIVVNCAGFADHTPTDELSFEAWNKILATNLSSVFLCGREALRRMKPLKRGRIITIGSISARMPRPHAIGYAATKGAIQSMNHSLALDARPFGITASVLHPGSTVSELSANMDQRPRSNTMATEDVAAAVTLMASLPNETNILELTMLPVDQPFLGRA